MSELNTAEGHGGASPIDIGQLARNTAGDRRLGREVLGIFREQSEQYLAALEGARDAGQWRQATHTLKGAARAIGALRVARLAEKAERLDPTGEGLRRQAIDEIALAVGEARRFIDYQLLDAAH